MKKMLSSNDATSVVTESVPYFKDKDIVDYFSA